MTWDSGDMIRLHVCRHANCVLHPPIPLFGGPMQLAQMSAVVVYLGAAR